MARVRSSQYSYVKLLTEEWTLHKVGVVASDATSTASGD